jgi:cell division septum initiation protein DivIVA
MPTLGAMALSFSRPDVTSPASVAEATFSTARRGADPGEVRELLRTVAAELGRLQERERMLERELRTARDTQTAPPQLDDDTVSRMLGEETLRVLQTARESASQIKIKAEEGAARILREATDEANRLREEAEVEAARRRTDAASDSEAELSLAKQQGREMVNEARAYRERVLSELARRRELARQQIEQLVHGRDRLLQAFERARLVAVDVVSELAPLGEPDEYVNLSHTTGPVPIMVPTHDVTDARDAAATFTAADAALDPAPGPGADQVADDRVDAGEREPGADDADPVDAGPVDAGPVDAASVDPDSVGEQTGAVPAADDTTNVVELFARLRAGAEIVEAGAVADAGTDSGTETETETESETKGEAEPDGVADAGTVRDTDAISEIGAVAHSEADATVEIDDGGDTDTVFDRRDAAITPMIVAAARKLKRVLADEQNGVLDALRRREPVRDLAAMLPALEEHASRYHDAIATELAAAARVGAESVSDGASATDLTTVHAALRDDLVAPLRDRLDRCVADGAGDNDEITRRVRAVYREWKTQHIDDQLDDVVRLAYGVGAYGAIAPGTPVCWLVDPNGPACPDAEDNALAGNVAAGEPFPTGHRVAPAHAGCRCVLGVARQ